MTFMTCEIKQREKLGSKTRQQNSAAKLVSETRQRNSAAKLGSELGSELAQEIEIYC